MKPTGQDFDTSDNHSASTETAFERISATICTVKPSMGLKDFSALRLFESATAPHTDRKFENRTAKSLFEQIRLLARDVRPQWLKLKPSRLVRS